MSEDHHSEDHADIREAVAKLCAQFPGEYWRKLDREMAYPKAFVDALTAAGYLSVLIPEEYGGAGLKLSAAAAMGVPETGRTCGTPPSRGTTASRCGTLLVYVCSPADVRLTTAAPPSRVR